MVGPPEVQEEFRASAFAPGHITGLFAPASVGRDPRGRGSLGAGIALDLGVRATATFRPGARRRVVLRPDGPGPWPISREVADRLLGPRRGMLTVELAHELPVGQGFGMSAAGALAVGLAVAASIGLPRGRAVEVAHLADLFGGGGLGGVASILGGGLEVRERPGIPPFGRVRHRPFPWSVFVAVQGAPIPSKGPLANRRLLRAIETVGGRGLAGLGLDPSPGRFLDAAEAFTDALPLAPPRLRRTIGELRQSGAWVAQAMFGHSLFAVAEDPSTRERLVATLERLGLGSIETRAGRTGARTVSSSKKRSSRVAAPE